MDIAAEADCVTLVATNAIPPTTKAEMIAKIFFISLSP
jgi:hypothetical protein